MNINLHQTDIAGWHISVKLESLGAQVLSSVYANTAEEWHERVVYTLAMVWSCQEFYLFFQDPCLHGGWRIFVHAAKDMLKLPDS